MTLKPGWLKRQGDAAAKDIKSWPAWMRREAGLESPLTKAEALIERQRKTIAKLRKQIKEHQCVLRRGLNA